jgi:hypothetical protein
MPSASERSVVRACALAAACLYAADVRAEGVVEPSYGRVEGDVTLGVGVGAVVAPGGPRAEAELRARYLETAGIFAAYEDGAIIDSSSEPRRVLAGGLELRPLFLYRWLRGHETHRARWDLLIDSFGIELGLSWEQPQGGSFASHPGFQAGLGLEVPLFAAATGPWLAFHGGLRWSDGALVTGVIETAEQRQAYLTITVAWHQVVSIHVVDAGDRAPE